MAASYDIDSKQISNSVAIKQGIAALLTASAQSEQMALNAYERLKAERDKYKSLYEAKCDEIEQLKQTIAAMRSVQPINNYHIDRDYVAAQYVQ